jgi:hypothetical protein
MICMVDTCCCYGGGGCDHDVLGVHEIGIGSV